MTTSLNILHVFRAPVGGLFRHVLDLTRAQIERGHRVGIITDSSTGGAGAGETFRKLAPSLALGLTRLPIRRPIGPGGWRACRLCRRAGGPSAGAAGVKIFLRFSLSLF
jgi:hypothetical protein